MEVGVRCVAVGLPGPTPMAVSVSGPAVRMTSALVADAVAALHGAAAELRRDSRTVSRIRGSRQPRP